MAYLAHLQRVHCAAVRLEVDDAAAGARHRGAQRERRAAADGPARQRQVRKRGAPLNSTKRNMSQLHVDSRSPSALSVRT